MFGFSLPIRFAMFANVKVDFSPIFSHFCHFFVVVFGAASIEYRPLAVRAPEKSRSFAVATEMLMKWTAENPLQLQYPDLGYEGY